MKVTQKVKEELESTYYDEVTAVLGSSELSADTSEVAAYARGFLAAITILEIEHHLEPSYPDGYLVVDIAEDTP